MTLHNHLHPAERRRGLAQLDKAAEAGDAERLDAVRASVDERLKITSEKVREPSRATCHMVEACTAVSAKHGMLT